MTEPAVRKDRGEWYADGLRFACTQCGNCCTGPPGYVWFTPDEGGAMARQLDSDEASFLRLYARKVHGRWTLMERVTDQGHDCVLLDRTSTPGKALCRVYGARPAQCRTWPFWPENLESAQAWTEAKRDTPCPGMDTGKLVQIEQIRVLRDGTS